LAPYDTITVCIRAFGSFLPINTPQGGYDYSKVVGIKRNAAILECQGNIDAVGQFIPLNPIAGILNTINALTRIV
jgi:hypothetical protein